MQTSPRETYLATEVHTATPPKLRWMLIDGALRRGEAARQLWSDGKNAAAGDALVKCHAIVGELLGSARQDDSELGRNIVRLYTYLFRTLTEAVRDHDPNKLGHVLGVLQVERETWRQVSDRHGSEPGTPSSVEATETAATVPTPSTGGDDGPWPTSQLSLNA